MDGREIVEAIRVLEERGLNTKLLRATAVVTWPNGRTETVSVDDFVRLAEIAREHATAGGAVIEAFWRHENGR